MIKFFQKVAEEEKLKKSFYEAIITVIPKPEKMSQKRKLQAKNTDEHGFKSSQQNSNKQNPATR